MSEEKPVDIGNANMRRLRAMLYRLSTSEGAAYGEVEREIIAYVGNLATPASPASAQPVSIAGLGSVTNEDDGVLTLRFKDEDSALDFMHSISPTVDCRDMPDVPAPEPVSQPVVAVPVLKLIEEAARAWNNEDESGLDRAMERIEIYLISGRATPLAAPVANLTDEQVRKLAWDVAKEHGRQFPQLVDHVDADEVTEFAVRLYRAAFA